MKINESGNFSCEVNTISTEAAIFEYISSKNIPFIGRFVYRDKNYYLYEFINGNSMKVAFEELHEKDRNNFFKKIGHFHYELSQIKTNELTKIGITEYNLSNHKLNYENLDLSEVDDENLKFIKDVYDVYVDSQMDSIPHLLHNDAHNENIFIRDIDPVFIDFGDMIIRDIHYDFYRYVYDYPEYWQIAVAEYEKLSKKKLNKDRIASISLLRHLRGFVLDSNDSKVLNSKIQKFRKETKRHRIEIKPIGSYFEVDKDGYIVNPAAIDKIQQKWKPVIDAVSTSYQKIFGDKLKNVYIRGSVAKGQAVDNVSDIDTFAYVDLEKEDINFDWVNSEEKNIMEKK